jgi:hypothetical protein
LKKKNWSLANLKASLHQTKSNLVARLLELTLSRCSRETSSYSLRTISCVKK